MKILETIFDEIAKELKLEITATELTATRQDMIDSSGGQDALQSNLVQAQIAPKDFDAYVRAIVISDKLSQALVDSGVAEEEAASRISQLITAKAAELEIYINPKYGIWNNESGDIDPVDSAGDAVTTTE